MKKQWANICLLAANSHHDFRPTQKKILALNKAVMLHCILLSTMLNENKTYTLRTNIISRNLTIPEQKSIDGEKIM
jgi:hypothetical protein